MDEKIRKLYEDQFDMSDYVGDLPLSHDELMILSVEFAMLLEVEFGIEIDDEEINIAPVEYWIELAKEKFLKELECRSEIGYSI